MSKQDPQIKAARLMMLGAISEMPEEAQEKVNAAADKLREVLKETGDEGQIALSLVAIENAGT